MSSAISVLPALSVVCREARERAGTTRPEIAVLIGRGQPTVERFERGETYPRGRDLDALVNAYGQAANVAPADLWRESIRRAETLNQSEAEAEAFEDGENKALLAESQPAARRARAAG